jgi:hypothetical protein
MALSVAEAVSRDLEAIAAQSPELAQSALAATATVLAEALDGKASPTAKSMLAKSLLEIVNRITELAPPVRKSNALTDLTAVRALRLAGHPAA